MSNIEEELSKILANFDKPKEELKPTQYEYSYVPMPEVESNPEEFIIPELLPACKVLWSKNIFTIMCSNRSDKDEFYIELDSLSAKNSEIFKTLAKKCPENFMWNNSEVCHRISISKNDTKKNKNIIKSFLTLVDDFELQDIQPNKYFTTEQYLDEHCSYEVRNDRKLEKKRKTLEQCIKDNNDADKFDAKTERIYYHKYYLDKHINYLREIENQHQTNI